MDDYETYLPEALAIVSAWELSDEEFADAVCSQAKLMSRLTSDEFWEDRPDDS